MSREVESGQQNPNQSVTEKNGGKFKAIWNYCWKTKDDTWLEDMRGNLSMATTLIAAITFQAAINPPGGIMALDPPKKDTATAPAPAPYLFDRTEACFHTAGNQQYICGGEAVLAALYPDAYYYFITFDTISFGASLSACLLLVCGIPLRQGFLMWFLSIVMCLALTCLAATYLCGVLLVTPYPLYDSAQKNFKLLMLLWIGLLVFVGLFLTIRFVVWMGKAGQKAISAIKHGNDSAQE